MTTLTSLEDRGNTDSLLWAWVRFDGHFMKALAEREVIAWRFFFFAIRHLLCDNKVALKHRLRLISSCVVSKCCWQLDAHSFPGAPGLLRRMIYVPRRPRKCGNTYDTMGQTAKKVVSKSTDFVTGTRSISQVTSLGVVTWRG